MKKLFLFAALCGLNAAAANAANLLITKDACVNVAATPMPDVQYQPGVDANGNAVAPADLPGAVPPIQPPKVIQIPLQINLQNALHIPSSSNLTAPQAIAGTIEYRDGQITFNGQPVSADAQAQIQAICQDKLPAPSNILSGTRSKNLLMGQ